MGISDHIKDMPHRMYIAIAILSLYLCMQTLTIDIINDKAIAELQDLESRHLIHVRKENKATGKQNPIAKLKGAMTKQPIEEIEAQLKELRDSWE